MQEREREREIKLDCVHFATVKEVHWRGHFYARAFTFRLTISFWSSKAEDLLPDLLGLAFRFFPSISIGSFPDYRWPTTFVRIERSEHNGRHNTTASSRKTIDFWKSWNDPKRDLRKYIAMKSYVSCVRSRIQLLDCLIWRFSISVVFQKGVKKAETRREILVSFISWQFKRLRKVFF